MLGHRGWWCGLVWGWLCVVGLNVAAADGIFSKDAPLEMLWNAGEFTEGVATRQDGLVFFSDIAIAGKGPGRILQFNPQSRDVTVLVSDSGQSNGLFFKPSGKLLAVCGANVGHRALCEVQPDGAMKVLAGKFDGKPFNSPNDIVVHPGGWVYFTDPRYVGPEPVELSHQSVYRYDPNGSLHRVTDNITKPNGVILSPDGKTLYVAETDGGTAGVAAPGTAVQPPRFTLNAFPVLETGALGTKKVLVNFGDQMGIDGMSMDADGRIYAAIRNPLRHGIAVYSPAGEEVDFLTMEPLPTNCTFGRGKEAGTLYITAEKGLYRIKTKATGFHPQENPKPGMP